MLVVAMSLCEVGGFREVNSAMTASGSRPSSARRSAARSQHIGLHRHCARCGQLGPARGRTVDGQDVMARSPQPPD